jgi:hypothetical protein
MVYCLKSGNQNFDDHEMVEHFLEWKSFFQMNAVWLWNYEFENLKIWKFENCKYSTANCSKIDIFRWQLNEWVRYGRLSQKWKWKLWRSWNDWAFRWLKMILSDECCVIMQIMSLKIWKFENLKIQQIVEKIDISRWWLNEWVRYGRLSQKWKWKVWRSWNDWRFWWLKLILSDECCVILQIMSLKIWKFENLKVWKLENPTKCWKHCRKHKMMC